MHWWSWMIPTNLWMNFCCLCHNSSTAWSHFPFNEIPRYLRISHCYQPLTSSHHSFSRRTVRLTILENCHFIRTRNATLIWWEPLDMPSKVCRGTYTLALALSLIISCTSEDANTPSLFPSFWDRLYSAGISVASPAISKVRRDVSSTFPPNWWSSWVSPLFMSPG